MKVEQHKILKALAHQDRLKICKILITEQELTISQLIEKVGRAQAIISQHVTDLSAAGIVNKRKTGTVVNCSLNEEVRGVIVGIIEQLDPIAV